MGRVGLVNCLTFENDNNEPPQYPTLLDSIFYPAGASRSVGKIGGSDRWISSVDQFGGLDQISSQCGSDRIGKNLDQGSPSNKQPHYTLLMARLSQVLVGRFKQISIIILRYTLKN